MDLRFFRLFVEINYLHMIGCVLERDSFHNLTIPDIFDGQYVLAKNAASGSLLLLISTSRHFSKSAHMKKHENAIFILVYYRALSPNFNNWFFNPNDEYINNKPPKSSA